jgi:RHS repeat-associated protein
LTGTPGSLQNLGYTYDPVGNVTYIYDHTVVEPLVQTQAFGYDALDRLTSAQAYNYSPTGEPGGSGITTSDGTYTLQNYNYNNSTGNMESNAGMSYTYDYPTRAEASATPAHGARRVTGGTAATGTLTVRARGTSASGTWPIMRLYVNGVYIKQWTVNSSSYVNYTATNTAVSANAQIDVVFSNAVSGRTLTVDYVTIPTASGPRTVQAESSGTVFDRGAENAAYGSNAFDGVNVINGAEQMTEKGALRFVVGADALATGYDLNGNMTLRVLDGARYFLAYDAENRLTGVSGSASATFVYDGDGRRIKSAIGTAATIYIGSYFEYRGGWGSTVSYYYAGGQRVAMRSGGTVEFLMGDHLGSTSLTVDSSGGNPRELRYNPWGEVRYASGTTPTDYRFTGQQEVASIGLYFYGARWYDAALGRFVQADTIIPSPGQPVAWDRYAYTANNPIKYIDPSGHHYCDSASSDPEECAGISERTIIDIIMALYRDPLHGEDDYDYRNFGDYRGKDPHNGRDRWHASIDAGNYDNYGESVFPVMPGVVVETGWGESGFGNYIVIQHTIGGNNFYSIYAHLGTTRGNGLLVAEGDAVEQNTPIGTLGNSTTGTSTQPRPPGSVGGIDYHLHFELRYETNVNLNGDGYLSGMRYWAFDSNWVNDFFDLGQRYGDYPYNPSNYQYPR